MPFVQVNTMHPRARSAVRRIANVKDKIIRELEAAGGFVVNRGSALAGAAGSRNIVNFIAQNVDFTGCDDDAIIGDTDAGDLKVQDIDISAILHPAIGGDLRSPFGIGDVYNPRTRLATGVGLHGIKGVVARG